MEVAADGRTPLAQMDLLVVQAVAEVTLSQPVQALLDKEVMAGLAGQRVVVTLLLLAVAVAVQVLLAERVVAIRAVMEETVARLQLQGRHRLIQVVAVAAQTEVQNLAAVLEAAA